MTLTASPASALPIATGLTVNDSVMLSTPSGVKLMNGFSFFDSMAARNGVINVRDYGAKGDTITDDAPAIQAALDAAEIQHKAVYIPSAGARSNGLLSFYRCGSDLALPETVVVYGDGPFVTEVRFDRGVNGFKLKNAINGGFTTNVYLGGMTIRGSADVDTSAARTIGLDLQYPNHCTFRDLWIQDFVDHIVVDAGDVGAVMTVFDNVKISSLKSPNQANGFPGYGIHYKGGTKKPQGMIWGDNCRIYAEESVEAVDFDGDGSTTDFDVDLGAKGGLFREIGLQVYVVNATTGEPERQVIGTDYDLFNIDSGEVAILPADTYVGADNVRVRFNSAPAVGSSNVRVYWSDPTGDKGIFVEAGTGNYFGGLIGGWDLNVDTQAPDNIYNFVYAQIARKHIAIGPAAHKTVSRVLERTDASIFDALVDRDPAATDCILMQGQPGWKYKIADANQAVTGNTSTQVAWSGDDYLQINSENHGTFIEVEAILEAGVTTTGASADADFTLEISLDNGTTWSAIHKRRVTGSRQSVRLFARYTETAALMPARGNLKQPRFRVMGQGVGADDTWTVYGGSTYESYLRAREVNPN